MTFTLIQLTGFPARFVLMIFIATLSSRGEELHPERDDKPAQQNHEKNRDDILKTPSDDIIHLLEFP